MGTIRLVVLLLGAFWAGCSAQGAQAPAGFSPPWQAPPVSEQLHVDGDVTTAKVAGIPVILMRVPEAEFVAATLFALGGADNWDSETAGVEQLACAVASTGGTRRMAKAEFEQTVVSLGGEIYAKTYGDFSVFGAKSLAGDWGQMFDLLADVFLQPALAEEEIERQRVRQLDGLRRERENPERYQEILGEAFFTKGTIYQNRPQGTEESVARIDRAAILAQMERLRERSRLVIVVVGDIEARAVMDQIAARFASLPLGTYEHRPPSLVQPARPAIVTRSKDVPTNYVASYFLAPGWGDPAFPAAILAGEILNTRINQEVRVKKRLSYAPGATVTPYSRQPLGSLFVSTTEPEAAMRAILEEVRKLRTEMVPDGELEASKSTFLTRTIMNMETTSSQAFLLGRVHIWAGDWRLVRQLPGRIREATAAEVRRFSADHIRGLQTVMVGKGPAVDPGLFSEF